MTCEEIIERLLDERKISVKEAMVMIKELVVHSNPFNLHTGSDLDIDKNKKDPFWHNPNICVAYGVTPTINDTTTSISSISYKNDKNKTTTF